MKARKVHLAVHYLTGTRLRYFPVDAETGWKIDTEFNQLVIGKGQPRTIIPLCNVQHYVVEEYWSEE